MSDQQQPDVRWAPLEPKPKNTGRVWLIVALVVAALVVVGVLLFFLLPRDAGPQPGASGTPTPSATASQTAAPTAEPEPSMTPITTPPPVPDPTLDAFREQVGGYLDDALTGLDIVSTSSGQDAAGVVETLQADLQRLSEIPSPTSIESEWGEGLEAYAQDLSDLKSAVDSGRSTDAAIGSARSSVDELREIVGL